jgi:hypothetical protein
MEFKVLLVLGQKHLIEAVIDILHPAQSAMVGMKHKNLLLFQPLLGQSRGALYPQKKEAKENKDFLLHH